MSALKNPKHERFAQELAKGATADEAYVAAGYKPNRGNAARLKANESILARVAAIQERGAVRAEITVARITESLLEIAEEALKGSESSLGVARQSYMDVAKLNGLIVEKRAQAQVSLEDLLRELDGDA